MTAPGTLAQRAEDAARRRAASRVVEAAEEFYAAAHAYGLNTDDAVLALHVPLALRVDAFITRARRTIEETDRLLRWVERLA